MDTSSYTRFSIFLRQSVMVLPILLLAFFAGQRTTLAQSTDRDNPTPLTSSDISGEFHQDDPEYFYGFMAQPGELTFTLDLRARNYGGSLTVTLFDLKGRELGGLDKVVMKGQTARVVRTIKFGKQQPVIMRIFSGNGEGYYRLRIDGWQPEAPPAPQSQAAGASAPGQPLPQNQAVGTGGVSQSTIGSTTTQTAAAGADQSDPTEPSTDRDKPTAFPVDGIQGEFHQDDPEYFYYFVAAAHSKLTFTLDLKAKNYGGAFYVTLFDQKGRELGALDKVVLKGQSGRAVKDIRFETEQVVILRIFSGNGEGYYKLAITSDAPNAAGMAQ